MQKTTPLAGTETLEKNIWKVLEEVPDPEIPTLSVVDLGIVTKVDVADGYKVDVTITPTFSGCPAINHMRDTIQARIQQLLPDFAVKVTVDFETQWNTNRITDKGREILKNFGLAPPKKYTGELSVDSIAHVNCPFCNSENTTLNTPFGPTLCRSVHYCFDCLQGFEQFKPL